MTTRILKEFVDTLSERDLDKPLKVTLPVQGKLLTFDVADVVVQDSSVLVMTRSLTLEVANDQD